MSFSWKEVLEEPQYDSNGTIEISTVEYRDMVKRIYELLAAGQKEHDDWYKAYKELEKAEKRLNDLGAWLDDDGESKAKFKLWKVEKQEDTEE